MVPNSDSDWVTATERGERSLPTCGRCGKPITPITYTAADGNTHEYRAYWEHADRGRVYLHQDCRGPWCAERAVKLARQEAAARMSAVLSQLPLWEHARVDSPHFQRLCRSPKLRALAASWSYTNGGSRLLLGASGCGKTTACIALVRRLCAEAIEAEVQAAGDECDQRLDEYAQRQRWRSGALKSASRIVWMPARVIVTARREAELGDGPPEAIVRATRASLLIVDELGSEPADRDGDLMTVVDARYSSEKPTIVTSGLPPTEFASRYGSALLRRLTDSEIGAALISEFR